MKKFFYCLTVMFLINSILTSCTTEKSIVTYDYPNKVEETLPVNIEKTEYFNNKLKVYFSGDIFSEGLQGVICYNKDFETIEETNFTIVDNTLVIDSNTPAEISGIKITKSNLEVYDARYLNSESYAMIKYISPPYPNSTVYGDKDSYFTAEEKKAEEKLQKTKEAFSLIEGYWYNKDKTKALSIRKSQSAGNAYNVITLENTENNADGTIDIITTFYMDIGEVKSIESEPVVIECTWNASKPQTINFLLYNNMTEIECELSDERFYKQVEEPMTISTENANS